MPTENYGINDYLDKVKDIRKRSIRINHPIRREKRKGRKINELQKKPGLWKIVEWIYQVYMKAQNMTLMHLKRKLRNLLKNPRDKNELSVKLKQYKGSSEEIKNAIKELKGFKRKSRFFQICLLDCGFKCSAIKF